jgi:hypothetical protein
LLQSHYRSWPTGNVRNTNGARRRGDATTIFLAAGAFFLAAPEGQLFAL